MNDITLKDVAGAQVPEFIKSEYTQFAAFLTAYNMWLDTNQADIRTLSDVDTTLNSFIANFKKELDYINGAFNHIPDSLLLRHIKNMYLSKGTEESYKTLFRLMFNKEAIVKYPEQMCIKASDGKWEQIYSMFIETISGDPKLLVNKICKVKNVSTKRVIDVTVESATIQREGGGVSRVKLSAGGSGYTNPKVSFLGGSGTGATGYCVTVAGVITNVVVDNPGINYLVAPVPVITDVSGTGCIFSLSIVNGGSNYSPSVFDKVNNIWTGPAVVFPQTIGTGSGVMATCVILDQVINGTLQVGTIDAVNIQNGGLHYPEFSENVSVSFADARGGNGAAAHCVITNGVITAVVMDSKGSSYSSATVVNFSSISSGATGHCIVENGVIKNIIIDDAGHNYVNLPIPFVVDIPNLITRTVGSGLVLGAVTLFELPTVHECNIDKNFYGSIFSGDLIYTPGFVGKVMPTINSYTITNPGKNFRIGQTFAVDTVFGKGTTFKVTKLTPAKGIAELQFIKYGYGYVSDFDSDNIIPPDISQIKQSTAFTSHANGGGNIVDGALYDYISTNSSSGYVLKETYVGAEVLPWRIQSPNPIDAFTIGGSALGNPQLEGFAFNEQIYSENYVGDIVREFYSYNKYNGDPANGASISFVLGPVCKYPGHYVTADGMLSDDMKLQDSKLYQKYSCIIQTDEKLELYKDVVKTYVHPAGIALFGEYNIRNDFNVKMKLTSLFSVFSIRHADACQITEDYNQSIDKMVNDESNANSFQQPDIALAINTLNVYVLLKRVLLDGTDSSNINIPKLNTRVDQDAPYNGSRMIYDSVWIGSTSFNTGIMLISNTNYYVVSTGGITATVSPTHLNGSVTDGTAVLTYVGTWDGSADIPTLQTNNGIFDTNTPSDTITRTDTTTGLPYTVTDAIFVVQKPLFDLVDINMELQRAPTDPTPDTIRIELGGNGIILSDVQYASDCDTLPIAYIVWTAFTAYAMNDIVRTSTAYYRVVSAGTCDGVEPNHVGSVQIYGTCAFAYMGLGINTFVPMNKVITNEQSDAISLSDSGEVILNLYAQLIPYSDPSYVSQPNSTF